MRKMVADISGTCHNRVWSCTFNFLISLLRILKAFFFLLLNLGQEDVLCGTWIILMLPFTTLSANKTWDYVPYFWKKQNIVWLSAPSPTMRGRSVVGWWRPRVLDIFAEETGRRERRPRNLSLEAARDITDKQKTFSVKSHPKMLTTG